MSELTALLVDRVAAHFPGARTEVDVVHTGLGDIRLRCGVDGVVTAGSVQVASLFFRIEGSVFGGAPVLATAGGYHETPEQAVIEGACLWTCTARPLLELAAGLPPEPGPDDRLDTFEAVVQGRRFRVVSQRLDRVMSLREGADIAGELERARASMADPMMARSVLASPEMPVLAGDHAYLLSTLQMRVGSSTVSEVRVNGGDWPSLHSAIQTSGSAEVALRELAVLAPLEPGRLEPDPVQRTLDALGRARTAPGQTAGWRGWGTHRGRLGAPLTRVAAAALGETDEQTTAFLTTFAGSGAGPGYGLAPRATPDGIALAEAGCGPFWSVRPDGTVWADARSNGDGIVPVAGSVTAWYTAWLDHAIGDAGPWQQWDWTTCACVHGLSQLLSRYPAEDVATQVGAGAMRVSAGAYSLPAPGTPLPPSHACVEVWSRYGVGDWLWPEVPPSAAAPAAAPWRRRGWGRRRGS